MDGSLTALAAILTAPGAAVAVAVVLAHAMGGGRDEGDGRDAHDEGR